MEQLAARHATRYTSLRIKPFLHKGLKRFYETGSRSGIQTRHAKRLRMIVTALDTAVTIDDLNIPGLKLHGPKGKDRGRWPIWMNGNWRITFEFRDSHAYVFDHEDPHWYLCTNHRTPGELIREVYLEPNQIKGRQLAVKLRVCPSARNRVLQGTSGIRPEIALHLSKTLGRPRGVGWHCRTIMTFGWRDRR